VESSNALASYNPSKTSNLTMASVGNISPQARRAQDRAVVDAIPRSGGSLARTDPLISSTSAGSTIGVKSTPRSN
jgi:hypothetical protein